ncbi:neprilysin-like isoform X2 [Sipha flava]|nr:neprilysin-like isoform X2 [Sipha flava]
MNNQKQKVVITKSSDFQLSMKKTRGHKSSYVLTFLFVIAILKGTAFGFTFAYQTKENSNICETEDCIKTAKLIVESMNKSADPCEDFYNFACGNYKNVNKINKKTHTTSIFTMVDEAIHMHIVDILEKDGSDDEPDSIKKLRNLYQSCTATDQMDALGLEPLNSLLSTMYLPLIKDSEIWSAITNINKYTNLNYLFSIKIMPDKNTIARIALDTPSNDYIYLTANKPKKELEEEDYFEDESLRIKERLFMAIWNEIYGFEPSYMNRNYLERLKIKLMNVKSMESELQKIYEMDTTQQERLYTVYELQSITDNITSGSLYKRTFDWSEYILTQFLGVKNVQPLNFDNDLILINNIDYFKNIMGFLASVPLNIIGEHAMWHIISNFATFTTNSMRSIIESFIPNWQPFNTRSLYCADKVNTMMPMAVAHVLNKKDCIKQKKKMLAEMTENIGDAFRKIIKETEWMDEISKIKALYKLRRAKEFLSTPDFIMNPDDLDDYYSDLHMKDDEFLGNILRFNQQQLIHDLSVYGVTDSKENEILTFTPYEVNAFNTLSCNRIVIPMGILQYPFFGHNLQVLNYGYLGFVLGHEITHGFDNKGRQFDADGHLNDWLTKKSSDNFISRTHCFIAHYGSYLMPGTDDMINGTLTLNENIADNGGIREAFWGYRNFVAKHGEEDKLPGLEHLSHEQIYFLAFSNLWCEAATDDSFLNCYMDEHCPNKVRVTGTLMNSEEFSQVWQCKKGTRMNPDREKCRLW